MDPPEITSQPMDVPNALPDANVTFSVTATGNMISYQWQKDGSVINDGADYSGTQTDTLTVLSVVNPDDEGDFNVQVTNGAGTVFSNTAMLTISKSL